MLFRKIGSIVRGDSTPFQLATACILGGMLGFMPGPLRAPGIICVLVLLLILVNANLALSVLVGVAAKLTSLAIMPVTFELGRAMLDGPLEPLFRKLINAPVTALFGFDYYVVTGGVVCGLVFGGLMAYLIARSVHGFRKTMADLEESSDKYKNFVARKSVRFFLFIFAGKGHGKKTYDDILSKKIGNPIRPLGVVFAIVMLGLLMVIYMFTREQIVVMALIHTLEQANGATVDVAKADVDLKEGRMTITGLAIANPRQLDTDLLRTGTLDADISATDLLRKRLRMDTVLISGASYGKKRATPGRLIRKLPPEDPEPTEETPKEDDVFNVFEIFEKREEIKRRYEQVRELLEKLRSEPKDEKQAEESLEERLTREIRDLGYENVTARHLKEDAPSVVVSKFTLERLDLSEAMPGKLSVLASNLSTHPHLLPEAPTIDIHTEDKSAALKISLSELGDESSENQVEFNWDGLDFNEVISGVSFADKIPFKDGTLNVKGKGSWSFNKDTFSLPMAAVLRNTKIQIPGVGEHVVDELPLPAIEIIGSLRRPRVKFNVAEFKTTMTELAKAELNKKKDELIDKGVDKLADKAKDALGDALKSEEANKLKGKLGGIIGEEQTKKLTDSLEGEKTDESKDKAKDLLKGLFGPKKKD